MEPQGGGIFFRVKVEHQAVYMVAFGCIVRCIVGRPVTPCLDGHVWSLDGQVCLQEFNQWACADPRVYFKVHKWWDVIRYTDGVTPLSFLRGAPDRLLSGSLHGKNLLWTTAERT